MRRAIGWACLLVTVTVGCVADDGGGETTAPREGRFCQDVTAVLDGANLDYVTAGDGPDRFINDLRNLDTASLSDRDAAQWSEAVDGIAADREDLRQGQGGVLSTVEAVGIANEACAASLTPWSMVP